MFVYHDVAKYPLTFVAGLINFDLALVFQAHASFADSWSRLLIFANPSNMGSISQGMPLHLQMLMTRDC